MTASASDTPPVLRPITADDPESRSADLVGESLARLRELFPEAFTEDGVDFDVLKQLLGGAVNEKEEKYGLNWHGKRQARQLALTPSTGTLLPKPEESVDWDTTQNLIIEGDNLEVLKLLQKSYAGKVKLIYIDPPYNTGKDFVYPDNYRDSMGNYLAITGQTDEEGRKIGSNTEASGRFHTDWLNMMYPRLKLAKQLLREDGLLCVSVDDSERDRLRLVLDEVFGEENFVESIIWKKRYGGGAKEKHLVSVHEYILVYAKARTELGELFVPQSPDAVARYYTKRDDKFETRGAYRTHPLEATKSMGDRPNLVFSIPGPDGHVVRPKRQWLWSRDRVMAALDQGEIEFLRDRDGEWTAHSKQYLKDETGEVRQAKVFSIIDNVYSQHGTNELLKLFGDAQVFPFPKPTGLLRPLLEFGASDPAAIVLDFFAGSGTLADAVMAQNASDSGARRYILVQLPEVLDANDANQKYAAAYCDRIDKPQRITELTKERVRLAARRVREDSPLFEGDLGFRVMALSDSNLQKWSNANADVSESLRMQLDHIRPGRSEAEILFELLLKLGLELTVPTAQRTIAGNTVYSVASGVLFACLAERIAAADVESLATGIASWHRDLAPAGETQVVVRDSGFADDVAKTNFVAILNQHGITNVRSL